MKVKSERSHLVVSDSLQPRGLQPTRLLCPWDFPGKSTGVGAIAVHGIFQARVLEWGALAVHGIFQARALEWGAIAVHGIFQARALEWGAIAFFSALYDV